MGTRHAERSCGDSSGRFDFVALDVGVLHRESPADRPYLAAAIGNSSYQIPSCPRTNAMCSSSLESISRARVFDPEKNPA